MENTKILFVDDEINLLNSIKRELRGLYDITTTTSAEEALELLKSDPDYAVIVADINMPGMKGSRFLMEVKHIIPDIVRMVMTGATDIKPLISAVNDGNIFRFIEKPYTKDIMISFLNDAILQFQINKKVSEYIKNAPHELMTICSSCKKIHILGKDSSEAESWENIEEYLARKFNILFSSGLCPECVKKIYKS